MNIAIGRYACRANQIGGAFMAGEAEPGDAGRPIGRSERRTSNVERRTSNVERRTSNVERRTSNVELNEHNQGQNRLAAKFAEENRLRRRKQADRPIHPVARLPQ
ncbi:hypothetical protein WS70_17365 [Burkholderia mayonis]|uniref:Uncharacterized protein n=1 Tax=Burkholderia mayonis TaxID=1385591 RepID=A0A1B4FJ99_9BURK|nr:hypothetical protein [Burkholderia mayonis]AOJ03710.1 hypothetical protein WS70_17365 [Burkholderia mayonis]